MNVPCVRVPPANGEATRQELTDGDFIADGYEIIVEDGWLYIPVTDPDVVSEAFEDLEIVSYDLPERETQTTPADLLGFDPSYERIGDVALLDEGDDSVGADEDNRDEDERQPAEIARAIVDSDLPVETVLNKASKIKGETRTRDWEVIEGDGTETVHREYGAAFELDLAEVYFSPRLATERNRVAEQVVSGENAFDMFAGVGPFVVPFAKRGATCVGVDINETAINYLRENARRNGVEDRVTAICDDVRSVAPEYEGWADRVVMNLPHSANEFLGPAVQIAGEECVLHYYDIQHEDDPFDPGERAIRDAAEPQYNVTVETSRVVRSYAPHELNVCLDVRLEG
ncbi:class I SAM-dependent methyltransferase family protein [Halostagnicola sp. A-GB9-2]|uniref:class I SAM-dependent methyltransferase n=1 Tax=Halostagnicola sp. A-GB9-2 TaxID=3048066 RepID=UPI0024BF4EE2|nr:class I SAM-dependent methyltransferase family protein [Halostagnicola sp. A-GB9-2]MDJ1430449.1 class I SAM-dependent methyltransferase family protein [Halostagnicola sp. A-GB9-2]